MTLKEFINSHPKSSRTLLRSVIAKELGVACSTVRSWANGTRRPKASQVRAIVNAKSIAGSVTAADLRPDVFDC